MESNVNQQPIAVTVARAANLIGVSPWSIREYAKTGRLREARVGLRRMLVPNVELEKFVQEATDAKERK